MVSSIFRVSFDDTIFSFFLHGKYIISKVSLEIERLQKSIVFFSFFFLILRVQICLFKNINFHYNYLIRYLYAITFCSFNTNSIE